MTDLSLSLPTKLAVGLELKDVPLVVAADVQIHPVSGSSVPCGLSGTRLTRAIWFFWRLLKG